MMGKHNDNNSSRSGGNNTKKSRMGRQKIEIKKIKNEEARQVCFSKRRNGLIKKAAELCILCGVEIAIIVFSPAGKAFSYGDPSVDTVIGRFLGPSSYVPTPPNVHRAAIIQELNCQHDELLKQIEAQKKRRIVLQNQHQREGRGHMGYFWDTDVENRTLDQLEEFMSALEEMRSAITKRAEDLMMGMAMNHLPSTACHHHHQPPPLPPSSSILLPSSSFLSSYNSNSLTIPIANATSGFMASNPPHVTTANASDYYLTNHSAARPFHPLEFCKFDL